MAAVFCSKCGSALDENGNCPNQSCVRNALKEVPKAPQSPLNLKPKPFAEVGKQIVPECIQPDIDEKPIKQYDIARLQTLIKGAFAEGRLQVTNKRVLFRSVGSSIVGPTSLQHEFSIEEIAGIELRKETRFNFFTTLLLFFISFLISSIMQPVFASVYNREATGIIFALLITIASVVLFFYLKKHSFIRFVVMSVIMSALPLNASSVIKLVLGSGNAFFTLCSIISLLAYIASLLHLAFAPNLVIRIVTKGGSPSVEIRRKDGLFSFQHNEYTGFSQVLPGPDVDMAMKELGALIREIQQTGGYSGN